LSAVLVQGLQSPESRQRLSILGAQPGRYTSAEFGRFVADEVRRWRKAVEEGVVQLKD
jgi:hypothetical protein